MLQNFFVVLGQVSTLFLLMSIGYVLARTRKLTEKGTSEMSFVLLYIVTPMVIINAFQTDWDSQLLHTLLVGSASLVVSYLVYILIVSLFFRRTPADLKAVLRFGSVYGNMGFMGLPLVHAVLGEEALLFVVLFLAVEVVFSWTHGISLMGGRKAISLKKVVTNSSLIGVTVGFILFLLRIRLSGPIASTVGFLADLNTPLAMLIIGAQMARSSLLSTFRAKSLYLACFLRLILLPIVTALLLLPFRLDPLFYVTAVIVSATPVAGTTSIFAERFQRDSARSAQLVTLSTLLSSVTMPIAAVLAQRLVA